mgnify:CR=1 FL=1
MQVEVIQVGVPVEDLIDDRPFDAGADKKIPGINALVQPLVAPVKFVAAEGFADRSRSRQPRQVGLAVHTSDTERAGSLRRAAQIPRQIVQRSILRKRQAPHMEILFVLKNLRRPQHGIGLLAQQVGIRNIGVDVRIAVIGIGDILRHHRHRDHVAAADDEQIVGFVLGGAAPETEIVGQQIPVPDPRIRRRKAHPAVVARFGVDESVIRGVDDMVADTVRERRLGISRQQFAHRAGIGAEFAGERPQVGEKDSFGHPPAGFLGIATLRTSGCGSPRSRAGSGRSRRYRWNDRSRRYCGSCRRGRNGRCGRRSGSRRGVRTGVTRRSRSGRSR